MAVRLRTENPFGCVRRPLMVAYLHMGQISRNQSCRILIRSYCRSYWRFTLSLHYTSDTIVSFFAFRRMLSALRTVGGSSFKSISSISGRSRLSSWFACRASLDKGSAMVIVGPDLYSGFTIAVRSDVSWILHVDNIPLLLREAFFMSSKWSE